MENKVPMKRMVNRIIFECDIVLLAIDARDPETTRNRFLEKYTIEKNKKLIYVLNKSDLVPKEILEKWKAKFKKENPDSSVVFMSAKEKLGTSILRDEIKIYLSIKNIKHGKVGIVGYPNVGKSSIINALTGRRSAKSGLTAGLTVGEQWVKLTKDIKLLDSPGIIEPKDEDELVISGALRYEKAKNILFPAIKILQRIQSFDKTILKEYYNLEFEEEITENDISKIGSKLNFLSKDNEIDLDRTSKSIIRDFQNGKLNYYRINIRKYEQKRTKNIDFITKHLEKFPYIDDANLVISHLEGINSLGEINTKPVIGMKKLDDAVVLISFSEKSQDSGRKKVETLARENKIEIYSLGGGKIGKHRIYIGVGQKAD
nr:GTPase [Methanococcus vannielii]